MYDVEVTLLSNEDAYGGNDGKKKLKILKEIGTKCELTDFAILLGAEKVDCSNGKYYGWWNTTSSSGSGGVISVERGGDRYSLSNNRYCGIRPVLNLKNKDEFDNILKRTQTDENGLLIVELGSYPINSIDSSLEKILDSYIFNANSNNNFKNNVGEITVDSTKNNDRISSFKPLKYTVVEFKGKRYVRVKPKSVNAVDRLLSNGKRTILNNFYWIEISPVIWYIDKENQRLISKYLVASGIRFCDRGEYTGDFKTTEMYEWLNKYFKEELFQGKDLTEEQKQESTRNMNEKSEKINLIVKEIRELLPTCFGSDDIMIKINNLVTKYNSDIKSIYNSNGLTTKIMDKDYLYNKLVNDLEEILSSLKQSSLKYKNYVDILNYIKECLALINSEEVKDSNDELQKDIITIKSIIIPFLENNNWLLKLKEIFEIEEKSIRNYLKDNGEIPSYKTKEEFIINIRGKLQEYLFNISEAVRNKNIVQELQEGYLKIMTGIFTKGKDDYINNYLNELNKIVILINKKGTQEEKDKLDILLSENSTLDVDTMKALEKLSEIYKKVYSIYLDIIDRENKLQEIDNYTIKI